MRRHRRDTPPSPPFEFHSWSVSDSGVPGEASSPEFSGARNSANHRHRRDPPQHSAWVSFLCDADHKVPSGTPSPQQRAKKRPRASPSGFSFVATPTTRFPVEHRALNNGSEEATPHTALAETHLTTPSAFHLSRAGFHVEHRARPTFTSILSVRPGVPRHDSHAGRFWRAHNALWRFRSSSFFEPRPFQGAQSRVTLEVFKASAHKAVPKACRGGQRRPLLLVVSRCCRDHLIGTTSAPHDVRPRCCRARPRRV
jgi:hypothetical protein